MRGAVGRGLDPLSSQPLICSHLPLAPLPPAGRCQGGLVVAYPWAAGTWAASAAVSPLEALPRGREIE